jgi:sporulation protein YlmC with PRC-barrel domain
MTLWVAAGQAQNHLRPETDPLGLILAGKPSSDQKVHLNDAAKVSDLMGTTVQNDQGEKLGRLKDLAVDMESGRIILAVLSTGGMLGIGNTVTAIPPGALHPVRNNHWVRLDATREKVRNAPRFEMRNWADNFDPVRLSNAYSFYGETQALSFIQKGDGVLEDQRQADAQRNQGSLRNPNGTPNVAITAESGLKREQDRFAIDRHFLIPVARLGQVQRVSKILGLSVRNTENERLGSLENILIDLTSGRIVAVVISTGGLLGIGDELSAVPPTALRFNQAQNIFQLDTTREQLGRAPHFRANQWPNFAQPGYASEVYRAYQLEPYFTPNVGTDADNTRRNVRDRNSNTLTPLDQGNSKPDLATTSQIRKEIVGSQNMSVNARNVKIITLNGRVTLRGPVNTNDEKLRIGGIADGIARPENVDNQLEITQSDGITK